MATLTDIPVPARLLGFGGAIPFVAGAVGVWVLDTPWDWVVLNAQVYYGCAILAFLGAVHWGRALGSGLDGEALWRPLAWSVTPALLAWVAALAKPDLAIVLLVGGLVAAYLIDRSATAQGWFPGWYGILRKYLSAIAVASLGASLVKVMA
ncbi:DUF3429 domain-containing protein [Thalassobaculum sp. OXR-137]|uniref:DUF3429 domain-containing protein n=1 Tax=Thalassobaculum sp. OXR-137 TaxID=3100173 RepID=UPI002AC9AC55|nr:DUF3429 domain-containing protein [Thalassobaculum sp. OXR-137]WPZ36765.1 DUF3429 domain-containing protein [Thalassobaculum sp. OXR-137]